LRGIQAVGVENRPLPLKRVHAYTTTCTTVQAVIVTINDHKLLTSSTRVQ